MLNRMWLYGTIFCGILAGCGGSAPRATAPDPAQASGAVRYLALGDSYTIGEGVREELRWPVQLAARLRERGIAVAEPAIIARTGWTTSELAAGIERAKPQGPFDLVSLLIGVNNQYRGLPLAEYRTEFRSLLQQAVNFAGGDASRVLVLSIPDWGVTPFAASRDRARIGAEIDQFNAINREETEQARARYVDVTPQSRSAAGKAEMFASDGLHPSGAMYAEWARIALPAATDALD